jgi:hypothetical protein
MAKPALNAAIVVVVPTAIYFGLAILGWGGLAAFFSHPALIALTAALFVMARASLFAGASLSSGERRHFRMAALPGDKEIQSGVALHHCSDAL